MVRRGLDALKSTPEDTERTLRGTTPPSTMDFPHPRERSRKVGWPINT